MAEIYEQAEKFKAALLARERKASLRLIRAYGRIWARLGRILEQLTDRIESARAAGEEVNQSWLFRQRRYVELMNQIATEMARFAEFADREITAEQRRAVINAQKDAGRLLRYSRSSRIDASFATLPVGAIESIAGFLSDGSPLRSLLNELPGDARRLVSAALQETVALGYNPRKTASKIKYALGRNLTRALRISRNETLRAYRESTYRIYNANRDIVAGWYWLATLSGRTCAACIALHGTFHELSKRQASHVQCRCTAIPAFKGESLPIEPGEKWFSAQDEATQRCILGSESIFRAFRQGRIRLTDLIGRRDDPRWGSSYRQLSLRRAITRASAGKVTEQV